MTGNDSDTRSSTCEVRKLPQDKNYLHLAVISNLEEEDRDVLNYVSRFRGDKLNTDS
jgi:hypothetical protein